MEHATPFYSTVKVLKIPELYKHEYFTIIINVPHLHCQIVTVKLTKFLKNVHDHQALQIILPHTFHFTKQSDFKKASGTMVLKYGTKFQQALKPNILLKALKYHIKIIY